MRCNVTIDAQGLALGKEISSAIWGSNANGSKGVQTMTFPHEGKIDIAFNVECFRDQEAIETSEDSQYMAYCDHGIIFLMYPNYTEAQVKKSVSDQGIGRALIGLIPQECKNCAECAMNESIGEFWKIWGGRYYVIQSKASLKF